MSPEVHLTVTQHISVPFSVSPCFRNEQMRAEKEQMIKKSLRKCHMKMKPIFFPFLVNATNYLKRVSAAYNGISMSH